MITCPVLVLMATVMFSRAERICPVFEGGNMSSRSCSPTFTMSLPSMGFAHENEPLSIPCCAKDFHTITWERKTFFTGNDWQIYPENSSTAAVGERYQILEIFRADLMDTGSYRCNVTADDNYISHETAVVVLKYKENQANLDPFIKGPENQTIVKYGGNVTFDCTGNFDHATSSVQFAFWGSGVNMPLHDFNQRYSVYNDARFQYHNNATILDFLESLVFQQHAQLTITDVRKEDVDQSFTCFLLMPDMVKNTTKVIKRDVFIEKDKSMVELAILLEIILPIVFGGIVVYILLLCVKCLYGPQIRLFCISRIPALGPKSIKNKDIIYNLFVYHADPDEKRARVIQYKMSAYGYKVYIAADIKGNQNVIHTFFTKTAESAVILFLYSKSLKRDGLANFFLQSLIFERKGKDIIFLEFSRYKPEKVMQWTLKAKDMRKPDVKIPYTCRQQKPETEDSVESEFGCSWAMSTSQNIYTDPIIQRDGSEMSSAKKMEILEDLGFWKLLPRIKVPKDLQNKRKMNNFWCSLRSKIPTLATENEWSGRKGHKPTSALKREYEPLVN